MKYARYWTLHNAHIVPKMLRLLSSNHISNCRVIFKNKKGALQICVWIETQRTTGDCVERWSEARLLRLLGIRSVLEKCTSSRGIHNLKPLQLNSSVYVYNSQIAKIDSNICLEAVTRALNNQTEVRKCILFTKTFGFNTWPNCKIITLVKAHTSLPIVFSSSLPFHTHKNNNFERGWLKFSAARGNRVATQKCSY